MNNIANTTTLWQLLGKGKVVIPILQRDYAQGRPGYENLREKFLSSIFMALEGKKQLKLDFVYGSSDLEGRFNPLDGQQRLTTLWLLHWYLAFRLGKLTDQDVIDHLSSFSYETRFSSSLFCQQIVKKGACIEQSQKENIADAIIRQTWIPSVWRQDPTVQSMLRMLSGERNGKIDGIEELFADKDKYKLQEYWETLMLPAAICPLVFYQLDLDNLGQSDDLYVKMNGRGKPLSDFENFKADLIKYIADNEWKSLLHAQNGLPILLDTKWLDFFWSYRNNDITLDDMMFGFINRFLLVRMLMAQKPQKIEDRDLGTSDVDKAFSYLYSYTEEKSERASYNLTGFGVYQTIFDVLGGFSVLYDLRTILENLRKFDRKTLSVCVKDPYEESAETFEVVFTSGKADLYRQTIPETICFWAVCQFMESPSKYCSNEYLKRWMRIVWNVCNYKVIEGNNVRNEIRNKTVLRSTILALHKSFPIKWDVYNTDTFNTPSDDNDKASLHIIEEQEKIRQFNIGRYNGAVSELQNMSWEEVLTSIERKQIFCGTIRALFTDESGKVDWSLFDTKYSHIMWYLTKYSDLNSIAFRNILLHDYEYLKGQWWFPKGGRRDAYWRGLLPYRTTSIHNWLMADPMDHKQLSTINDIGWSYTKRSLIKTSLLHEVKFDKGVYTTYSWTNSRDVLIYYSSSYNPYVLFNEARDKVVNEAIREELIELCYPQIQTTCGLFNAKDIEFMYNDNKYIWDSKGVIYKQDAPDFQLPQPDTLASFLECLGELGK